MSPWLIRPLRWAVLWIPSRPRSRCSNWLCGPGGLPRPKRRDPQLRVERGPAGVHDLLRRTNPNPMTATIIYTDCRTPAVPSAIADTAVNAGTEAADGIGSLVSSAANFIGR